ncbi:MAG: hypothetical protein ABS82_00315 [Rhodanobacter sp. SCN 67-45]|nr:MAG: hypothetical protein ABS82_00315 [Rhodanobacter sp. SCN 67-45]
MSGQIKNGGPVDVLAMMDALLAFASRGVESDDPARQMIEAGHEARAAVAELIEAASDPAVHVRGNGIRGWQRHCEAVARLRTALANAGGAK